jgi:chorismate mutase
VQKFLYSKGKEYVVKNQESFELHALGESIANADKDLINILATRMCLAKEVARCKIKTGKPILRKSIEKQRTAQMVKWAREVGLDDLEFVRAMSYLVIAASCRVQIETKESYTQACKR